MPASLRRTVAPTESGANVERLHLLGERYFITQNTLDPYNATLLGLNEFDHLAGDVSHEASSEAASQFAKIAIELEDIDVSDLPVSEQIDHAVLTTLNHGAYTDATHSLWAANASAKSYVSRQALIFQAIPAMTITDGDGAERYLNRLSSLGKTFQSLGDRYIYEAGRGRCPTAIGVQHSVQQLEGYLAIPLPEDILLRPCSGRSNQAVREKALGLIETQIRPAMNDLATLLRTELMPLSRSNEEVGILHLPGGEQAYSDSVARHTTTSLLPSDIHQLGLDILEELKVRWSEIGHRAIGERNFITIASRMRADPALRFRTQQEIIEVAQTALERAENARDGFFPPYRIPACVIEEINPIDAEHAALAYYRPPAEDGSRPGAHCLLTTDPGSRYSYEYEALAFHESTPGHHLQLSTAQTLQIPRYRRHLDVEVCGFIEGWGLYAEQLADEMGLYSNDLQRLGMLSFSALRACRLVIDTGIHHFGWSRERAMDFMWANTVTTKANVRNEVDRYIAWPGQALSYMIGKQEILRLRTRAERTLGTRFSLIDFHGIVLENGAVPLSVLDQNVRRWERERVTAPQ